MDVRMTRPLRGTTVTVSLLLYCLTYPLDLPAKDANDGQNWSGQPADSGWAKGAYSPDKVSPNYGDNYNPDGSPKGTGDASKPYDSYNDPHHPLKNPDGPPDEWVNQDVPVDADGDGKQDVDESGKPVTKKAPVFPQDGSPPVQRSSADIDWKERYYDSQFDQMLSVTNRCLDPQPVSITVNDLPFLTLPKNATIGGGETKVIVGKVKLPPEPPPPLKLGLPGEPGWGWVDIPPIPPGQPYPLPKIHQPNFAQIDGTVEIWHPWSPASAGDCLPKLTTYTITGQINHIR